MRIRGLVFCLFFAAIFVTFSCNSSRQKAARAKTKPVADEIASAMKEVKSPLDAETIGPLHYANIDGSPLVCIFDMEVGEAKALVDGDEYVVVQIVKSEKVPMPPLKDIYAQIRESLLQKKQQLALKTWIESVNKSAKVTINDDILKRVAYE